MKGTITRFRPDTGAGWIMGENGEEFFLRFNHMRQKQKHYKVGRTVTFDPLDVGRDHREAGNVTVEVPPPAPPTGRGHWDSTNVRGRIRCSDCHHTTDQQRPPYCMHCGAVMRPELPDNDAEINRTEALWRWKQIEYGYRCGHCKLISILPFKYCPRCGKFMEKFPQDGCQNGDSCPVGIEEAQHER